MQVITNIVVALIAVLHVYILVLEMFLWEKPAGLRAFRQTKESAAATKVLAANQGLYNGFLAAGLFWGLLLGAAGHDVKFFLVLRVYRWRLWCCDRQPQDFVYTECSSGNRFDIGFSVLSH